MAASDVSAKWLDWVAQLAGSESRPTLRRDRDRFACWLEEQPGLLVPQRLLSQSDIENPDAGNLRWNRECIIYERGDIPPGLCNPEEWRDAFAFDDSCTLWVGKHEGDQQLPFAIGDELTGRCQLARESGMAAAGFTPAELGFLCEAGALIWRDEGIETSHKKTEGCSGKRAHFQQDGYCAVDSLLHPFHLGELRRYYRRSIRRGRIALGDYQSARRYVAHNEPVARFFHFQLAPVVAQLVGESVKPSYVYFASYQSGADLKKHTDREQCEFSVTMCIDYAPEPEEFTPWPLYLHTKRGRVRIDQKLGDGLLYRGTRVPHSRHTIPEGHTSTSIFFHYVPIDFSGSLT